MTRTRMRMKARLGLDDGGAASRTPTLTKMGAEVEMLVLLAEE